jgi:adenine C2-methylase RlmN of 23S rRNA A2503 and tRNA A37
VEQQAGDACRALGYTLQELTAEFGRRYGRGAHHAEALFRTLYAEGNADITFHPRFRARRGLAEQVGRDFALRLPELVGTASDADASKLTLRYADGARIESVLIPMRRRLTLCVSSQIAYVLVPGVNDRAEHARELAAYLRGLRACVNVIPCVPPEGSALGAATAADARSFYDELVRSGQLAKIRASRGGGILASCGQLATGPARRAAGVDTPL